uniref:Uncharacterized protein n=1 Tax=Ditylenchus dipsaci TaxID=166011 RepID=A0A915CQL8_9BILA
MGISAVDLSKSMSSDSQLNSKVTIYRSNGNYLIVRSTNIVGQKIVKNIRRRAVQKITLDNLEKFTCEDFPRLHVKALSSSGKTVFDTEKNLYVPENTVHYRVVAYDSQECDPQKDEGVILTYIQAKSIRNRDSDNLYKRTVDIDLLPRVSPEKKGCFTTMVIERDLKKRAKHSGTLTLYSGKKCSIRNYLVKPRKTHCVYLLLQKIIVKSLDLLLGIICRPLRPTFPPEEISKYIFEEELIDEDDQKIKTGKILLSGAIKSYWKDCIFSSSEKLDNSLEICYFYYDSKTKQAMNVKEGENFRSFEFNGSYPNIVFDSMLNNNITTACINVGGCAVNDNITECDNVEQSFYFCYCVKKLFCDYDLLLMAQQDEGIQLYVPFCNVGNFTASTTLTTKRSPQLDYEKFFCYERLYFKNAVDLNTKPEAVIELVFFTFNMTGDQINQADCLNYFHSKRCVQLEDDSFFCCCLASLNLTTTNSNNIVACNSGKDVQRFKEQSLLLNPSILDDTVEHQQLCEDNSHTLKKPKIQEMGLGLNIPAMCYFKMPMDKSGLHVDDVKSYFYNVQNDKESTHGIFAAICKTALWRPSEHAKGCSCRFLDKPLEAVCPRNPQIFCVAV